MKVALPLLLIAGGVALAEVKLPPIISDHMVLEKSPQTAIWGKADAGEKVTVTLGDRTSTITAGEDGKWRTTLDLSQIAFGPFELKVSGKNELVVRDVVVGEVWLASGQSNMQFALKDELNAATEIPQSANSMLRHFKVDLIASIDPLEECQGQWVAAGPGTSSDFTAVGYYFGKALHKELGVPVGLINASWGGTQSEAWTSVEALSTDPDLKASVENQVRQARDYPAMQKDFIEKYGAWLQANGREDRAAADAAGFTTGETKDWISISIPGPLAGQGLPPAGAVWARRDITVGAKEAGRTLILILGEVDGYETVYWNGQLVGHTTWKEQPGASAQQRCEIPGSLVKEGENTLAVRVYSPSGEPKLLGKVIKAGAIALKGEWLAKSEYALPALSAEAKAGLPAAPPAQRMAQGVGGALFNGMIHPILPYTIKGVIWYQGESNATRAVQYRKAFPLLINDWRTRWGQPEMPFYFCQLANYMAKKAAPEDSRWAELREAQSMALKLPHTGQAVLIDIGESEAIHPLNKKDAGERLAKIALANDYGRQASASGPLFQKADIESGKIRVKFSHTDGGLVARPLSPTYNVSLIAKQTAPLVRNSPESEVEGFAICGKDGKWVWAQAKIEGDDVIVWSEQIPEPTAVRYAWADNPTANLYNKAGLPASPFRTDSFPELSKNLKF